MFCFKQFIPDCRSVSLQCSKVPVLMNFSCILLFAFFAVDCFSVASSLDYLYQDRHKYEEESVYVKVRQSQAYKKGTHKSEKNYNEGEQFGYNFDDTYMYQYLQQRKMQLLNLQLIGSNRSASVNLKSNSKYLDLEIEHALNDASSSPKHNFTDLRQRVNAMFYHAYDGYMQHAFPKDELRPLSCTGADTWGSYSLTLVDALDTLVVLGNHSEFRRAADLLLGQLDPLANVNVSIFETNIRIVGGLLSAHLLSRRAGYPSGDGWPCSGPLLAMAERFARRLLPAFETATGMPYGTVNLRYGVPPGETPVSCTACVGTLLVEFGALTRLTGDPVFEASATRALRALHALRSPLGLVGNHVDVQRGRWTALEAGIGSAVDSYFEYLVKAGVLLQRPELLQMFNGYKEAYNKHVRMDDWYFWVHMEKGHLTSPVFQSLDAFWPGVLSLVGDTDQALRTLHNYHQVWKAHGALPEFYSVPKAAPVQGREAYPLRPELIESIYYVHRATGDPAVLQMGVDVLYAIERTARTECGFATISNVLHHSLEDRMESFFLAETVKYLHLLFQPDSFLHSPAVGAGEWVATPRGLCHVWAGAHVFNTEAHPIDAGCLDCCHSGRPAEMPPGQDEAAMLEALGLTVDDDEWLLLPSEAPPSEAALTLPAPPSLAGGGAVAFDSVTAFLESVAAAAAGAEDAADGETAEQPGPAVQQQPGQQAPAAGFELLTCPAPAMHQRLTVHGQVLPAG